MKNFFRNLGYKLQGFMQNRNGNDELNRFLVFASLFFFLLSLIRPIHFLYYIGLAVLVLTIFRALSKNIYRRQTERNKYLEIKGKVLSQFGTLKNMWRDRKTHRYFKCPSCKTTVRIKIPPKGATISLKCPKCGMAIIKKF